MDTRVAVISIIAEASADIGKLNNIFHEYREYIIGRMGLPYREKGIYIISVALDAPQNIINALSGKIGKVSGISIKTVFSNH